MVGLVGWVGLGAFSFFHLSLSLCRHHHPPEEEEEVGDRCRTVGRRPNYLKAIVHSLKGREGERRNERADGRTLLSPPLILSYGGKRAELAIDSGRRAAAQVISPKGTANYKYIITVNG